MKTILPETFTTADGVNSFIAELHKNDEFFHLDDSPADIIKMSTGERLFTDAEAEKITSLMAKAFEICEVWELPIIDKILQENNEDYFNH